MTYNLRGLRLDRSAAVRAVRDAQPDVLGVQEPPRGPRGGRRLAAFAAACGLGVVVGGRGARTTALLARPGVTVARARALRLPWRPGRTRRGAATADLGGVRVVVVHLGLVPVERSRHAALIDRELLPQRPPVGADPGWPCVVLADLNEHPDGPAWRLLGADRQDAGAGAGPTFPAHRPRARIDAVLVGGLDVRRCWVPDGDDVRRASDHRPVVADLVRRRGGVR